MAHSLRAVRRSVAPSPSTTRRLTAGTQRRAQAAPLGVYYETLLSDPIPYTQARGAVDKTEDHSRAATEAKARIVFGSRLAGPAERKTAKEARSTVIAGVRVPPRPTEPDNCCMSGCVNCVWDVYRDDLEEWSAAKRKADRALQASATSVDDDGGGSDTNWAEPDVDQKLFEGIPVGILEFMKQEKRLKEKHAREHT